jgi:hypothetical protein
LKAKGEGVTTNLGLAENREISDDYNSTAGKLPSPIKTEN